jgi:hypothetical protein
MTASGAGQGGSRLPLWRRRPTWWPGFKAWARDRAEDAGKGFTDLHDKIKELGPAPGGGGGASAFGRRHDQ